MRKKLATATFVLEICRRLLTIESEGPQGSLLRGPVDTKQPRPNLFPRQKDSWFLEAFVPACGEQRSHLHSPAQGL